jgi:hypothetical protein
MGALPRAALDRRIKRFCGTIQRVPGQIDSKLTNLFHHENRTTMGAGKETWTTSLSSALALAD